MQWLTRCCLLIATYISYINQNFIAVEKKKSQLNCWFKSYLFNNLQMCMMDQERATGLLVCINKEFQFQFSSVPGNVRRPIILLILICSLYTHADISDEELIQNRLSVKICKFRCSLINLAIYKTRTKPNTSK